MGEEPARRSIRVAVREPPLHRTWETENGLLSSAGSIKMGGIKITWREIFP